MLYPGFYSTGIQWLKIKINVGKFFIQKQFYVFLAKVFFVYLQSCPALTLPCGQDTNNPGQKLNNPGWQLNNPGQQLSNPGRQLINYLGIHFVFKKIYNQKMFAKKA